jgi:hypothetical protein
LYVPTVAAAYSLLTILLSPLSFSLPAAAGVLGATALLTGVYYATPKETKDRIKRSMKKTGDE